MNNKNPQRIQVLSTNTNLKVVRTKPVIRMLALTTKGGDVEFVNEEDITYCKANGRETLIYFNNERELIVPKLLKTVLENLSESGFHRVHNSYIVNMGYARKFIKKNHGGELELYDGQRLPVSGKNRNYVLNLFKIV